MKGQVVQLAARGGGGQADSRVGEKNRRVAI